MPGALKTKGKKENKIITDPIPSHFLRSRSQEIYRTSRSYRDDVSAAASKKKNQKRKKKAHNAQHLSTQITPLQDAGAAICRRRRIRRRRNTRKTSKPQTHKCNP
jgi:hypothetical protein